MSVSIPIPIPTSRFRRVPVLALAAAFGAMCCCSDLMAGTPDAGTIHRVSESTMLADEKLPAAVSIVPSGLSATRAGSDIGAHQVNGFVIEHATLIDQSVLREELADLVGKTLTFDQLVKAADRITDVYFRAGFLAEAYIPPQEVRDGVVVISVLEPRFGTVRVRSAPGVRLDPERAAAILTTAMPAGANVTTEAIDRGFMLLSSTPGAVSQVEILPGGQPGTLDAQITMERAPLCTGTLQYDNMGDRSTGEHEATAGVIVASPLRFGDRLQLKVKYSDGVRVGRMQYAVPIGTSGLRARAWASVMSYESVGDFASMGASGNSTTFGSSVSAQLIARRNSSLSGTVSCDYRRFIDQTDGEDVGDKHIGSASIALSGMLSDSFFGGGKNSGSAKVTFGDLDLSNVGGVRDTDSEGARTNGGYCKVGFMFSREQTIRPGTVSVIFTAQGQIASTNLDTSEKFMLGGPSGVRAYPMTEGWGDSALLCSAELTCMIGRGRQLSAFYDWGTVRQYQETWDGWQLQEGDPNIFGLSGIGASLRLGMMKNLTVKGTVATRIGSNPLADDDGNDFDGTKRVPRFWLESTLAF